jgi:hypothetical protein
LSAHEPIDALKRNEGRPLTTHAGSLPRPVDLTPALRHAGASTKPRSRPPQGALYRIVPRQIDAGIELSELRDRQVI